MYEKNVKRSVGNNVEKALHNMPLLFMILPTLFFTPFSYGMKVLVCRQDTWMDQAFILEEFA
jgi:hypothetical protein